MDTAGRSGEDRWTLLEPGRTVGCGWWLLTSKTTPHGFALCLLQKLMMHMDLRMQGAGTGREESWEWELLGCNRTPGRELVLWVL